MAGRFNPNKPETTKEKFARTAGIVDSAQNIGMLLLYDLKPGDIVWATLSDMEPIHGTLVHQKTGLLEVDGDINGSQRINLGSFAQHAGPLKFLTGGLLRGSLQPGSAAVVDISGTHFVGDPEKVLYLPNAYETIMINGMGIDFKTS